VASVMVLPKQKSRAQLSCHQPEQPQARPTKMKVATETNSPSGIELVDV
jgi:hypothetical protein